MSGVADLITSASSAALPCVECVGCYNSLNKDHTDALRLRWSMFVTLIISAILAPISAGVYAVIAMQVGCVDENNWYPNSDNGIALCKADCGADVCYIPTTTQINYMLLMVIAVSLLLVMSALYFCFVSRPDAESHHAIMSPWLSVPLVLTAAFASVSIFLASYEEVNMSTSSTVAGSTKQKLTVVGVFGFIAGVILFLVFYRVLVMALAGFRIRKEGTGGGGKSGIRYTKIGRAHV